MTLGVLAVFLLTLAVTYAYAWYEGYRAGHGDGLLEVEAAEDLWLEAPIP